MVLYKSAFCNALSEVLRNIYYTKKQKVSQRGDIVNRISKYLALGAIRKPIPLVRSGVQLVDFQTSSSGWVGCEDLQDTCTPPIQNPSHIRCHSLASRPRKI